MGNTCTPVVDSSQYMAKPIQYCKVKKKNVAGQLSPCATIREPVHSGACVLQLENPHNATTETVHHHERSCMMQQTSHMPQLRPHTAK